MERLFVVVFSAMSLGALYGVVFKGATHQLLTLVIGVVIVAGLVYEIRQDAQVK